MTTLTQPGEMTIAPALMSSGEADLLTALSFARLAPEQIAGAYSLVAWRQSVPASRKQNRPHLGHTGSGLFYPK